MFTCLSSSANVPHSSPFVNSHSCSDKPRFGSQEALVFLHNCSRFTHLKLVHAKIIRHGLVDDQLLIRKLIQFCFSYRKAEYATLVFRQVRYPDTFTWNLMISAYTKNGNSRQALLLYNLMICRGFPPDKFTFPFVIKACLAASALDKGKEIYGLAIKTGFSNDVFLRNILMNLYFKCRDLDYGRKVFDKMFVRSVVSWTTFVSGLVSCGQLDAAREAFDQMPTRNVVSWTAMIYGFVRNGRSQEAFELFWKMPSDKVRPNQYTLVALLKACTELESLQLGTQIHEYALQNGFKIGAFLGTALIDMYSKCGNLEGAKQVFDNMDMKSLATWNSMITSFGVHGYGEEALILFAQMKEAYVQPDAITYVGILCAYLNLNDVEEGVRRFKNMTERYGITPILEHYTCMIQLYTRANMLGEANKLMKSMPMKLNNSEAGGIIWPIIVDSNAEDRELFEHQGEDLLCFRSPMFDSPKN